jgi:threonine dehydrogenase-like Zn-dependent dehydrogenase
MNTNTPISTFLQTQRGKPVVLVQGLGFVGSVMSLVVANAINGSAVIGVEQDNETGRHMKELFPLQNQIVMPIR